MKLNGTEHPADAVRKEIDKLRSSITDSQESTNDSTQDFSSDSGDSSEQDPLFEKDLQDPFEETTEVVQETPREQTVDYWKHRFDVIQGKYHAETADLRSQLSSLKESIEDLSSKQSSQYQSIENTLDNLEEEYGEEFSNALNSRIQNLVNAELQRVTSKVDQEISSVRQVQAKNEEQLFQDSIAKFVPNWVSINTDPNFITWLDNSVESFSGFNFMAILRNAYEGRDLDKVTKIFQTYIDATRQQKQPQVSQEQASMITPPKRGSVANNTLENNSGKVFTQSEIQEFYRKLSAGDFKGKDEYIRQTKLAILQANAEGRII